MGSNATATLFFGTPFELPEDEDGEAVDFSEWEDKLAAARGVLPPPEPYGNGSDSGVVEKHRAYRRAKSAVVAAEPCAIDSAGSGYDSDSCHYVYFRGSATTVDWGPAGKVKTTESTPEQTAALVEFCKTMGIEHEGFGWHLAAFYG